ncbi:MAG TPA: cellulose-binding domain-containing protein [Pilimelia sp.]|nr:cellulose-binding domain-containing protein [Pilimelia sp.]
MPRPRRRQATLVAAAVVLSAGAGVAATMPTAQAASPCRVDYTVNQWAGGFTASVRLAVTEPRAAWTLTWTYAGDQRVTSAWNSQTSQSGAVVTARNAAWNGAIAAGGSVEFGLQGTYGAGNPTPTDFALDGVPCNDAAPTPTAGTPTSGAPTAGPTATAFPTATPTATPAATPTAGPDPQPAGCAGAVLCDGFEGQAGGAPSGAWTVTAPNCTGTGTATVDTAVAHAGGKSIRIDGTAGYCNHVFVRASQSLSTVGPVIYGRYYVRHTTPLPPAHVTFMALRDDNDGGRDLRMGGQNSALQWNRESDDATLPEQSPNGVALSRALPTGQWNCVEFQVDGSLGHIRTWLNGAEVPGLAVDGVPTRDIDSQWLNKPNWRPALSDLRLGWESYGDGADTLWFDDVAVGSARVGC